MKIARAVVYALMGLGVSVATCRAEDAGKSCRVYIGTFTRGNSGSKGIYLFELDADSGKLSNQTVAAEVANPGFLAIAPNKKFLYSVGEMKGADGKNVGAVNSFSIDPSTGKLTLLNQEGCGGGGPCYVGIDPAGKNALVANYGSGGVAILPVNEDGTLGKVSGTDQHHGTGPVASRQAGPHAHSFFTDPAGKFALSPDLGTDKVYIYKLDSDAHTITPADPAFASVPPGSGPRHLAFSNDGKIVYVLGEVAGNVTVFKYDDGKMEAVQTITTLPEGYSGPLNTSAEIKVHPNGKFLYASNRGHDSVAIYSIGEEGKLTFIGYEQHDIKFPRSFNIDPTGKCIVLSNEKGNSLTVYKIDQGTGLLTETQHIEGIGSPVCVKFW